MYIYFLIFRFFVFPLPTPLFIFLPSLLLHSSPPLPPSASSLCLLLLLPPYASSICFLLMPSPSASSVCPSCFLLMPPPSASSLCLFLLLPPYASFCFLLMPPPSASSLCLLLLFPPYASSFCFLLMPPPSASSLCFLLLPPPSASSFSRSLQDSTIILICMSSPSSCPQNVHLGPRDTFMKILAGIIYACQHRCNCNSPQLNLSL